MEEMLRFFMELLKMTTSMVDDIMPDILLHLDKGTLENLMALSQEATTSLQVFVKLCGVIARKNLSCPSPNLSLGQGLHGESMSAVDVQQPSQSQLPQSSSVGDRSDGKSVVTNFSDVTTFDEGTWKVLLTDACNLYSSHNIDEKPQVYYCGVCNKQAKAKHIWEAHLSGKTHAKLLANVDVVKFTCGTCGLHLCGDCELVSFIIGSDEHRAFDVLVCDNSPGQSTTSECSSKVAPDQQEAELPDESEQLDKKPVISAPSSAKSDPEVISRGNTVVQNARKVTKVVFQKTDIHSDFVYITDVIARYVEDHEAYAIGYCRPCEVICESKNEWNAHKCTAKHKGKMHSKHYKNVLCRCLQCEFVITAGLKIAVTYMKYHIEKCHLQSTDGIKIEEYMQVKNLCVEARKKEPASKAGSFKGSAETVYSVRSSVVDMTALSADLRSSSADLVQGLNDGPTSSEIPGDVPGRGPGQHADVPMSRASCRSIEAEKKISANPYKSSNKRPTSDQVSELGPPEQISSLPAQNDHVPAPNDAPAPHDPEFAHTL